MSCNAMTNSELEHVTVVGCGAIGSHFVLLLARMFQVGHITLVDPDEFSGRNVSGQNIFPGDVGEPKVGPCARRARAVNPKLQVTAIRSAVEDVPLGTLRADLIVSCVDSRSARQAINEIACRLQIPLVDAGVLGSMGLVRVSVYRPGPDACCLECSFDDRDYAALEAEYPCGTDLAEDVPSDSSSALASLAASLLALECQRLWADCAPNCSRGRQVTLDTRAYRVFSTEIRRNPLCKFDHSGWDIRPLRCSFTGSTVAGLLSRVGVIRVARHRFTRRLVCPRCGFAVDGLRLDRPHSRCPRCHARMIPPDFAAVLPALDSSLPAVGLGSTLTRIGLLPGDVINGNGAQFELLPEIP